VKKIPHLCNMNAANKLKKAGFWLSATKVFDRILKLLYFTVIFRLLSPEEVGLYGLLLTIVQLSDGFTRSGFKAALIQKSNPAEVQFTVWLFELARGLFLYAVLFFGANLIGGIFEVELTAYLRLAALTILLRALMNIRITELIRALDYKKQFFIQSSGSLFESVGGILLLWWFPDLWTILWVFVGRNLISFLVSYLVIPFVGIHRLHVKASWELTAFGKWIFAANIVFLASIYLDDLIVGKLLGMRDLGYYHAAFKYANIGVMELGNVFKELAFPAVAVMQHERHKVAKLLLQFTDILSMVVNCITGFLIVSADTLIPLLMGPGWEEVIPVFQLLCLVGWVRSILGIYGAYFKGIGQSKKSFILNTTRVLVLLLAIFPGIWYLGLMGVALASVLSVLVLIPVVLVWLRGTFLMEWKLFVKKIGRNTGVAVAAASFLLIIKWYLPFFGGLLLLLSLGFVYGLSYLLLDYFLVKPQQQGACHQLQRLIKR